MIPNRKAGDAIERSETEALIGPAAPCPQQRERPRSFPWHQWTDRLKELQAMHLSAKEMALRLTIESGRECNRNAVIGKLKRLGLSPKSCPAYGGYDRVTLPKANPRPRAQRVNPFNPYQDAGKKLPPAPPLAPDQKEYILGQGVPLNDDKMEIVGRGKQASIRWNGGLQRDHQCHWPTHGKLFCGVSAAIDAKTGDVLPYCVHHCRIAYIPASGMKRREYVERNHEAASAE
jgi:hypothetical protein